MAIQCAPPFSLRQLAAPVLADASRNQPAGLSHGPKLPQRLLQGVPHLADLTGADMLVQDGEYCADGEVRVPQWIGGERPLHGGDEVVLRAGMGWGRGGIPAFGSLSPGLPRHMIMVGRETLNARAKLARRSCLQQ